MFDCIHSSCFNNRLTIFPAVNVCYLTMLTRSAVVNSCCFLHLQFTFMFCFPENYVRASIRNLTLQKFDTTKFTLRHKNAMLALSLVAVLLCLS